MPKLHLVGITPDHRGLVLSEHARAKRGDMVLEIDDRLLEAIDKAQRLRLRDEGHRLESAALPTKRVMNGDDSAGHRLTPREIQQRLRAGESVAALARSSGTDEAWIRRFAAPVLAEQAKVIERARALIYVKRGVGPSGAALGPAVAANVIDRGVPLTLPELEAGWGAYQHPDGGWHVTFTFPVRGRRQTAEWELDGVTGELTARNKLASELGWREPGRRLSQPKPAKVTAGKRPPGADRIPTVEPEPARTGSDVAEAPEAAEAPQAAGPPASGETAGAAQVLPLSEATASGQPGAPTAEEPSSAQPGAPAAEVTASAQPGATAGPAPAARKPPARKAPAPKAPPRKTAPPAKRSAAAVTEAPAQSVVPVPPAGSMPPTDLDVVDVLSGLTLPDDDDQSGAAEERTVVIPRSVDDEIILVDESPATASAAAEAKPEAEDEGDPTGPISLPHRPQPAPLGAPPAPPGGPPAP